MKFGGQSRGARFFDRCWARVASNQDMGAISSSARVLVADSPRGSDQVQLVEAAQRGERAALSRLLTRLAPSMLATCRKILGPGLAANGSDAEDATQDALVDLARGLGALEDPRRVQAYAVRIAARRAIRARRQRLQPEASAELEQLPAEHEGPDASVARQRRARALLALLDELPEAQAEALYLRVALGYSLPEVSATMGVSTNTVRSRVRLAREALRRKLDKRPALRLLLEPRT